MVCVMFSLQNPVQPGGAPAVNASLELWNPRWPDFHWGPQTKIDADGWYVIDLPEGELYNLFARAEGSDGNFPCAGPEAVVASTSMQPIVLVLDGSERSCFDKQSSKFLNNKVSSSHSLDPNPQLWDIVDLRSR